MFTRILTWHRAAHKHCAGTARETLKLLLCSKLAERRGQTSTQPRNASGPSPSAPRSPASAPPEAPCTQRRGGGDGTLFQVARKKQQHDRKRWDRGDRAPGQRGAPRAASPQGDRAVRRRVRGQDLRRLRLLRTTLPSAAPAPRPLQEPPRAAAQRQRHDPAAQQRGSASGSSREATAGGPAGAPGRSMLQAGGRPGPAGRATQRWPSQAARCPSGLERSAGPAARSLVVAEDAPSSAPTCSFVRSCRSSLRGVAGSRPRESAPLYGQAGAPASLPPPPPQSPPHPRPLHWQLLPARRPRPFLHLLLLLSSTSSAPAPLAARRPGRRATLGGVRHPPRAGPPVPRHSRLLGRRWGQRGTRRRRKKVLVQTPATVATLARFSALCRNPPDKSTPCILGAARSAQGEPQSWACGRRGKIQFLWSTQERECPKPTSSKGIAFPPFHRPLEPPLGTP